MLLYTKVNFNYAGSNVHAPCPTLRDVFVGILLRLNFIHADCALYCRLFVYETVNIISNRNTKLSERHRYRLLVTLLKPSYSHVIVCFI